MKMRMIISFVSTALILGCATPERSTSGSEDAPAKWLRGTVTLEDGKSIAGTVGWKPVSQQYVVKKDDMTILIPIAKVERVVVDDPDRRRDPWELKRP